MKMTLNGFEPRFLTFPDGQPHVDLTGILADLVNVRCSIRSPLELMQFLLVMETLNWNEVCTTVQIGYLMGARMDRRIDNNQPSTMEMIARMMSTVHLGNTWVFNIHSDVGLNCLASGINAKNEIGRAHV